jgi:hypothetical protein
MDHCSMMKRQHFSKLKLLICLALFMLFMIVMSWLYRDNLRTAKFRSLMDDHEITYETYTLEVFDFDTKALMRISNV